MKYEMRKKLEEAHAKATVTHHELLGTNSFLHPESGLGYYTSFVSNVYDELRALKAKVAKLEAALTNPPIDVIGRMSFKDVSAGHNED